MARKIRFLSCFALLACGFYSFCQTSANLSSDKIYTIADIKVTGNNIYEDRIIILSSGFKVDGKIKIPGEQIGSAIRKLWKAKVFSDVAIYIDRIEGDNVYLNIEVKELPVISKIEFIGVGKSKQEDLVKDLNLQVGKRLDENLITGTKNYLKKDFVKKGYRDARIIITTEQDTANAKGSIVKITADKGDKVKINSIEFEGNNSISSSKLRSAMKETKQIRKWNIFKASKFIENNYQDDLIKLVEYYKKKGYRDAAVVSDTITFNEEDKTLDVKIKLTEGNKYHYRSVKFVGNSKFPTDQLQEILGITKGDVYNGELLEKKIRADKNGRDLQTLYMDNGYLFAYINPVEVSAERDSIDLEIRIIEGEKAYINKIIVSGNTRSFDHVAYREITTKPGDLFSKSAIQHTMQKLSALGFFDPENIGVNPKPNPATNTVDIEYTVVEKNSSQIELQGGWGGGQIIGTIGLSFNNFSIRNILNKKAWKPLPMGEGQTLSLRAQASLGYTSYQFQFIEPWLGGRRPFSISASFHYTNQREYNYYTNERLGGKLSIMGGGINIGKRLSWPDSFFTFSGGVSYQRYDWNEYNWGLYRDFDTGISNDLNVVLNLSRRASGQSPIYPMYGSDISFTAQLTPPYSLFNKINYSDSNLSDVKRFEWLEYYKFKFKATWYNNIFAKLVLVSNIEFGYLGSYDKRVGLGPFERFEMGGSGMTQTMYYSSEIIPLRGYSDSSIYSGASNSTQGDPIYNKLTFELRYPITMTAATSIYALLFAEGGNTFSGLNSWAPFQLRRSAGAGVRIFMPMFGLLGFDFGYGFDPMPGREPKWEFHFTLGQNMF